MKTHIISLTFTLQNTINKHMPIPKIGKMLVKYPKYYVVIWINKHIIFILQ
jgi:hypothetical protein